MSEVKEQTDGLPPLAQDPKDPKEASHSSTRHSHHTKVNNIVQVGIVQVEIYCVDDWKKYFSGKAKNSSIRMFLMSVLMRRREKEIQKKMAVSFIHRSQAV